jgi:hypothetical protein
MQEKWQRWQVWQALFFQKIMAQRIAFDLHSFTSVFMMELAKHINFDKGKAA